MKLQDFAIRSALLAREWDQAAIALSAAFPAERLQEILPLALFTTVPGLELEIQLRWQNSIYRWTTDAGIEKLDYPVYFSNPMIIVWAPGALL